MKITGTVSGRTRTPQPADPATGVVREKITYRLETEKASIMLDDWAPPSYLPIGVKVTLPVLVRAYARRGGAAAYSLQLARANDRGEQF